MAELATSDMNDMPDEDFAYIEPGGVKDKSGKTVPRSNRHFYIGDKAHADNAAARIAQGAEFGKEALPKVVAAQKKFGTKAVSDDSDSSRLEPSPYTRSFALEDCSIRAGGDGRTVEAYAAVFDTPSAIRDQDGEYEEVIDPGAFNRALEHAQRSGHKIPVMFNHGMTLFSTPSESGTMPIGVTEDIRAERRGLFTRSRYNNTPLADAALENIRSGSISAYSFSGAFKQSQPRVPRGGLRRNGDGTLPTLRRVESTLREYGPTPFPAYQDAQIVGVRAEQAAMLLGQMSPGERERLAGFLRYGADPASPDLGTPPVGPAADDPPAGHSTRSLREELLARRRQLIVRQGGDNA